MVTDNQAGQYYNIEAGYAPNGKGFYMSATLTPANDANIAVAYTSPGKANCSKFMRLQPNRKPALRRIEMKRLILSPGLGCCIPAWFCN